MRQLYSRRGFVAAAVALAAGAGVMSGSTGCQQRGRTTKVPGGAMPVGKAQMAPFTWTADRTGTLYVVDVPEDTVIYRGPLRTGQMVVVDPQVRRISVDGRIVSEGKFKSGHRNDIYLQSGAVRNERPSRSEDRVGQTS